MPNAWVSHVKQYAAANKISYGCALSMSECKNSYKSTKPKHTYVCMCVCVCVCIYMEAYTAWLVAAPPMQMFTM